MNTPHPRTVRRALRFLQWFCPPRIHECIEGDILQQYEDDLQVHGEVYAQRAVWRSVFSFFRPAIILRNKFIIQFTAVDMFRNYLTITFRNLLKSKVFSAINIVGLGIGIAACLLILQFVMFELSFDKFNDKFERIYRVTNDRFQHGKLIQHGTITYPTVGPAMAADFPEIEQYTRLMPGGTIDAKVNDEYFRGDVRDFVDGNFLSVFSYPLLAGDLTTALKGRYKVVITERLARKYFGVADNDFTSLIGKTLYAELDPSPYQITGVCANVPENSHLYFDILVSYETLYTPENHDADDSWTWSDMRHYVVLKPGMNYKALEAKFPDFSQRHFQGDKVSGSVEKFYLQPLKDAHLFSDYEYDIAHTASGKAVWAMMIVAGFILFIAWINYINLTTSKAIERAKEVGLRKVMGAMKGQLVRQFIFESVVISLCAFIVGIGLVALLQKYFNTIIDGNLTPWKAITTIGSTNLMIIVGVMAAGVLLSGFYPAFILSSYQPITVLKGKFQKSGRGSAMRKGLVIFQFMASVALITGTLIVSKQLRFMNEAQLGLAISNTLIIEPPSLTADDSTIVTKAEAYEVELSRIQGVKAVTTSINIPGRRLGRAFNVRLKDQPAEANVTMSFLAVDHNFFETYNIPLLAGREFTFDDHHQKGFPYVVMNEKAIKLLGLTKPEDAVGRNAHLFDMEVTIIGVVGNYHQESLKKPMEAMVFFTRYTNGSRTSIRIDPTRSKDIVAEVESVYKKIFPGNAFEYFSLEDSYKGQYNDENRFARVVNIFAVLAMIISCLGLIGLSSYTAVQRTKEIGIRKALGASTSGIVSLLSMDFLKLVGIASILGLPIAWYFMNDWLEAYAYRISLDWMMFLIPPVLIIIIAAITISFQIVKTAMTNPSDTLKYE